MPCDFRIYGSPYQEFFILRNMTAIGPEVGKFSGVPFHAEIQDEWGRIYRYVGTSPRKGPNYTAKLGEKEFILPPGIVYRMLDQAREKGVFRLRASCETSSIGQIFVRKPTCPR